MKTFLALGQSNCHWLGPGGDWPSSSVVAWNNMNNRSDLLYMGTSFVSCNYGSFPFRTSSNGGPANNAAYHACAAIAAETGESIRLIMSAFDGRPISDWFDGTARGPGYSRLQAVMALAGVTQFDGVMFAQSEADDGNAAAYLPKFDGLVSTMESDGIITGITPFIVTTPTVLSLSITGVIRGIGLRGGRFGLADFAHLPRYDTRHYSGSAAAIGGAMYAKLILERL